MRIGSLFSGVGGIDLGLEAAGMTVVWQSEIEPYPCEVLAKHWPGVPNLGDITKIDWSGVEPVDLICGGFPCQDISVAGKGAGIAEGTRSGLWFEFARAIRALRPRYVLVENVAALAIRGLNIVLGDLADAGYDAEWAVVRASDVGAYHRRARLFIVAHARCECGTGRRIPGDVACPPRDPEGETQQRERLRDTPDDGSPTLAAPEHDGHAAGAERRCPAEQPDAGQPHRDAAEHHGQPAGRCGADAAGEAVADPAGNGWGEGRPEHAPGQRGSTSAGCGGVGQADAPSDGVQGLRAGGQQVTEASAGPRLPRRDGGGIFQPIPRHPFWDDAELFLCADGKYRATQPRLGMLASGVPRRVAKLKALGNSVVPQVAEYIGRCIMEYENEH